MKALPYLSIVWDTPEIEGLIVYSNIKALEENGDPKLAKIYYDTLSPEYREYYHVMEEVERKGGESIEELSRYWNKVGEVLAKYYPEYVMPEESRNYN